MVVVTNTNDEPFGRRFNGEEFTFPPGERVTIDEDAARYIFAYGGTDADRARILVRNGWQRTGRPDDPDGPRAAAARLQRFVFNTAPPPVAAAKPTKRTLPGQVVKPKAGAEIEAEPEHGENVTIKSLLGQPIPSAGPDAKEIAPGEPGSAGIVLATEPPEPAPAARVPTGIAAMGPNVDAGGQTKVPRGTISLPGRSAPLAPYSGPAR